MTETSQKFKWQSALRHDEQFISRKQLYITVFSALQSDGIIQDCRNSLLEYDGPKKAICHLS